jgi:hypothetical protein
MADAELFCSASMQVHGDVVPTALIRCPDESVTIFSSRNLPFEMAHDYFEELALYMCTCHNAVAAVLVNEAWCRMPKQGESVDLFRPTPGHDDRKEAIVLLGQIRGGNQAKLLPTIRSEDAAFSHLGAPLAIQASSILGHGADLIASSVPDAKAQRRAQLKLHFVGISPDSGSWRWPISRDAEKHHVISPHGIPLTHEPFRSKALAEEFIPKFCVQMRRQGYYPGVGETIPLEELPGRLMVVPETGTFEAFATTMRQNQERQKCRDRQRGMQG